MRGIDPRPSEIVFTATNAITEAPAVSGVAGGREG